MNNLIQFSWCDLRHHTKVRSGSSPTAPLASLCLSSLFYFTNEQKDDDNGEWMQLLRPSELREVMELDRARKEVERQIIHANQVSSCAGFTRSEGHTRRRCGV